MAPKNGKFEDFLSKASKIDISRQKMDQLVGFLLHPHFLKLAKK